MSLRTPSRRARRIAVAVATPALLALTGWMLVARVDPASAVAALGRADARLSALAGLGLLLGTVASAFIWRLSVRAAGLEVVQDRCIKMEHCRFFGGLNVVGLSTGVVGSRRMAAA